MKKINKMLTLAVVIVFILLFATACGSNNSIEAGNTAEEQESSVITNFGKFESVTFQGEKVTEDIFKNSEVTMINMWGTFCSPCINEMPYLETISKEYSSEKFQLVGLVSDNMEAGNEKVKSILEQTGVTYTNIMNSESLVNGIMSAVQAVPTTVFVNSNGDIINVVVGGKSYDDWKMIIDQVLESI